MKTATRKTTLDLDVDLLAQAQRVLGTTGIKETIDRALSEVVAASALRRYMQRLSEMEPIDIDVFRRQMWER